MKKIAMLTEEQYGEMMAKCETALVELDAIKEQLAELGRRGQILKVLEQTEDLPEDSAIHDLFEQYSANYQYAQTEMRDAIPEPVRALMAWFEQNPEQVPEEIRDGIFDALADYEKQWFANGFMYAMSIVNIIR